MTQITSRRSDKLNLSKETIRGDIVVGQDAVSEGLVDGLGTVMDVMLKKYPSATLKRVNALNLKSLNSDVIQPVKSQGAMGIISTSIVDRLVNKMN